MEKDSRRFQREEERRDKKFGKFEKKMGTPKARQKIVELRQKYGFEDTEASVRYSSFNHQLAFVIEPSNEDFRELIQTKRPKEVHYEFSRPDDAGNPGSMYIVEGDIQIYSNQYIFGYPPAAFNDYEELGYKREDTYTAPFFGRGKFVRE